MIFLLSLLLSLSQKLENFTFTSSKCLKRLLSLLLSLSLIIEIIVCFLLSEKIAFSLNSDHHVRTKQCVEIPTIDRELENRSIFEKMLVLDFNAKLA